MKTKTHARLSTRPLLITLALLAPALEWPAAALARGEPVTVETLAPATADLVAPGAAKLIAPDAVKTLAPAAQAALLSTTAIAAPLAPSITATANCVNELDVSLPSSPLLGDVVPALDTLARQEGCPQALQRMKSDHLPPELPDLCAAYLRYHAAMREYEAKTGQKAPRIADLVATRFINRKDWDSALRKTSEPVSPYTVYDPKPKVWKLWDESSRKVDAEARFNEDASEISRISRQGLKTMHTNGMTGLLNSAGKFRSSGEYGKAIEHWWALPVKQVEAIRDFTLPGPDGPRKGLVQFHPTPCLEERDEAFRKKYLDSGRAFYLTQWPAAKPGEGLFTSPDGTRKQCGYLMYAPGADVQSLLDYWFHEINHHTRTWKTDRPEGDPILIAARAQRNFIGIHPFEGGNGRSSRFVMDWLLQSLGLPPANLREMDDDVGTAEHEWAREVGRGVLRSITTVERCAKDPKQRGCEAVPLEYSGAK